MVKTLLGYRIKFFDAYISEYEECENLKYQWIRVCNTEKQTIKNPVLVSYTALKYKKNKPEYELDFETSNFRTFLRMRKNYSYIYFNVTNSTNYGELVEELMFILNLANIRTAVTKDGRGVRIDSEKGLQVIKLAMLGSYENGFKQRIDINENQVKSLLSNSFTKIKDGYLSIEE